MVFISVLFNSHKMELINKNIECVAYCSIFAILLCVFFSPNLVHVARKSELPVKVQSNGWRLGMSCRFKHPKFNPH